MTSSAGRLGDSWQGLRHAHARSRFWRLRAASVGRRVHRLGGVLLVVATITLTAACGDDGGRAALLDDGDRPARPDTTHPVGTDSVAVTSRLNELLHSYDNVVNQVVIDPRVADDPHDPLIEDFLALFEDDSAVAAETVEQWSERAEQGLVTEPYSDDFPITVSSLDGEIEAISEDEVTFSLCVLVRARVLDSDGEEVGTNLPRVERPGNGVAVRTPDGWRLRDVSVWSNQLSCEAGLTDREAGDQHDDSEEDN